MPRPTAVSELQQKLFKRMGVDVPERQQWRQNKGSGGPSSGPLSRRLQRKSARAQKKSDRYSGGRSNAHRASARPQTNMEAFRSGDRKYGGGDGDDDDDDEEEEEEEGGSEILDDEQVEGNLESDGLSSEDQGSGSAEEEEEEDDDEGESRDLEDDDSIVGDSKPSKNATSSKKAPRSVREKLSQDDAEIDEYERKLGIKKGRNYLPQAFKDDGLDDLLGDLGADVSPQDQEAEESLKRKRDYDEWLSAKRRKTKTASHGIQSEDANAEDSSGGSPDRDDDDQSHDSLAWSGEDDNDDAFDEQSFDGFGSDDKESEKPKQRVKENPYKAPATGAVMAKYVPPSLRKAQDPDSEVRARLQKQLQGQINRLTEANILSIVQAIEGLYQSNARGDVTEILTNIILAQMQSPDNLTDQFFVLTGGFSAAIYKVIGSSFGSHLVREVVKSFGQVYETCQKAEDDPSAIRKEASNMIAFLGQLYLFEVAGCKILFDYMERFLANLNELNIELLLRICRIAGNTLRKDDSNALKHVTSILSAAVAKVGYANVSARTKFMIETLNDLKNSKPKAKGLDSSIVSDHVLRMRKRLGELKSRSRRLDGLAPMGVGLDDLEQADTAGKWWLVGACVPVKDGKKDSNTKSTSTSKTSSNGPTGLSDDEDMDFVLPDYPKKARDQGLNTMAQIAIFTAIMSAMNYEHGYQRYVGLGLKREDQLEIARVLVQCVGSESQYNEYYALVGRKACSNPKVKFAFQDRLWKIFRSFGESLFGDESEAEETADSERMKDKRRISHVARFYASFVSDGAMAITILKPLNLPEMNEWTALFVEWFMIGLLRACLGKGASKVAKITEIFGPAAEISSLAAGISWFLEKRLRRTKLVSTEELKKLDRTREKALAAIQGDLVTRELAQ